MISVMQSEIERAFWAGARLGERGDRETWSQGKGRLGGELSMELGEERLGRARRARSRKRERKRACLPSLRARGDAPGGVSIKEELEERGGTASTRRCLTIGRRGSRATPRGHGEGGGSRGARAESNWTAGGPGRRGTAAPVAMAVAPCSYRLKMNILQKPPWASSGN